MRYSDEQIIRAVLTYPTNKQAAESLGMNLRYFYRRLHNEELKAQLEAAQRKLLDDTINEMSRAVTIADETLIEIMTDKTAPKQTRVNAADNLERNYLKFREQLDIISRLEKLEREFNDH